MENGGVVENVNINGLVETYHDAILNAGKIDNLNVGSELSSLHGYSIINYDTGVIKSFNIRGSINGAILNAGTIDGNVNLGDSHLVIEGSDSAKFDNAISGTLNSTIGIGDDNYQGIYTTSNNAAVGRIKVEKNSALRLFHNTEWRALSTDYNAFDNEGSITMSTGSKISGNLLNTGALILNDTNPATASVNGNITNSGSILLNTSAVHPGNNLIINGSYSGLEKSKIYLGGILAGDASLTDKLIINGNAEGHTIVEFINNNGIGSKTLEGIQIIKIKGNSEGVFSQGKRIVAGMYDYKLQKGNSSGTDTRSWYLTSFTPVMPTPQPKPFPQSDRMVRPEAGVYASNLEAARTLFNLPLNDIQDQYMYIDPTTGRKRVTSMWLRTLGGHGRSRMSDMQNENISNRYVLQLGGNLGKWKSDNLGSLSIGAMGGYATQNSRTHNILTGNQANGNIRGYNVGLYSKWFKNKNQKTGLYVNNLIQYSWFNDQVNGESLESENYKTRGLSASFETGYSWELMSIMNVMSNESSIWLQPHAQVSWAGISANEHTEANGTEVKVNSNHDVETKVGVRALLRLSKTNQNDNHIIQPFIEANWIHRADNFGVSMSDQVDNVDDMHNSGEVKVGVIGHVTEKTTLDLSVAEQMSGRDYRDTEGMLDIRYIF
ncbi:hypothetical protein HA45_21830 [Pantoea rodasii]|nr:hypothetical protein HA45_21830 [Pantoea rodasii]